MKTAIPKRVRNEAAQGTPATLGIITSHERNEKASEYGESCERSGKIIEKLC
jgi:hypothetical protein